MAKFASVIFVTIGVIITAAAVIAAVLPRDGQRPASPANATTLPTAVSEPHAIKVEVAKVIDGPSDAVLKEVLAGLVHNQGKLRSIHVIGTVITQTHDMRTGAWLGPVIIKGEGWAQGGARGQVRDDVSLGGAYIVDDRGFRRDAEKSYIETWDGTVLYRVYGPPLSRPSAETFDTRWLHGQSLLGEDFSMQLPWDEETESDAGGGSRKTIDRNPLAASVLAQMKLAARHVILDDGQDAMELKVINPDNTLQRSETFWFDLHRGYGLVARVDVTSRNGMVLRTIIHRIDELTEASAGVFYPSKGAMFWEEQGSPFQSEQFDATRVVGNEPLPATLFHIDFPAGVPIVDFKDGRGTKRSKS